MNFWNAFLVMVSVCLSTTLAALTESMQPVGSADMKAVIEECKKEVFVMEVNWILVLRR